MRQEGRQEGQNQADSPEACQTRIRILHDLFALARTRWADLNEWERGFLLSMAGQYGRTGGRVEPSEKQAICLLRIEDKLGGLAAVYAHVAEDVAV